MRTRKLQEFSKQVALFAILGALQRAPWAEGWIQSLALFSASLGLLISAVFTLFERDDECECDCTCGEPIDDEATR